MNWLEQEEKIIQKEQKEKFMKDYSTKKMLLVFAFIAIIFGSQALQSYESIECPCCSHLIELEAPKARECPGAGWYCDNCGMFQCHGQRCAYCKCKR